MTYEACNETASRFMTELAKAKNDTAFIEELRQRNIGQE